MTLNSLIVTLHPYFTWYKWTHEYAYEPCLHSLTHVSFSTTLDK